MSNDNKPTTPAAAPAKSAKVKVKNITKKLVNLESGPLKANETGTATRAEFNMLRGKYLKEVS